MVLTKVDKELLLLSVETEQARVRRSINAEKSQAIREIHSARLAELTALHGRIYNEVAK